MSSCNDGNLTPVARRSSPDDSAYPPNSASPTPPPFSTGPTARSPNAPTTTDCPDRLSTATPRPSCTLSMDHDTQRQLQQLRDQADALQRRVGELQELLDNAVLLDDDRRAAFASTAQAEGVSLPVCRRLLAVLLDKPVAEPSRQKRQPPSVAQLGRLTQEAARALRGPAGRPGRVQPPPRGAGGRR